MSAVPFLTPEIREDEDELEQTLRPRRLDEFVGQPRIKEQLAIVSGSPADELRRAIVREDHARFQAIPGIGRKTAERIVLELKEKLVLVDAGAPGGDLTARDALVELGWTLIDAERALAEVDQELSIEEQVRNVLRKAA